SAQENKREDAMRGIAILFAGLAAILAGSSAAFAANTSAGLNVSRGESDSMSYSVNIAQKYDPLLSNSVIDIAPVAEIGGHAWVPKHDTPTVWGGFLAPGVRLTLNTDSFIQPYVEGTVGGEVNSKDKLGDRDLGSNVLFRTRGAVGVSFGEEFRHRIQGEYTNHSTWGITKHNDGNATYGVSYGYSF
ncbi:MAG: acyloxyacyl hydrolase, partial [Desulfovibrio sp.]|nr:acyloxyacyl hydrolase [Desulfovibrio sp.]